MATVAERLKEIMDIKNLRQVDLVRLAEPVGEESGIHLSKSHISQYLSGKSQPRRDILKVMAQALGVNQQAAPSADPVMLRYGMWCQIPSNVFLKRQIFGRFLSMEKQPGRCMGSISRKSWGGKPSYCPLRVRPMRPGRWINFWMHGARLYAWEYEKFKNINFRLKS